MEPNKVGSAFFEDEEEVASPSGSYSLFSREEDSEAFNIDYIEFKLIVILSIVALVLSVIACFWYNYLQRQQRKVTDA